MIGQLLLHWRNEARYDGNGINAPILAVLAKGEMTLPTAVFRLNSLVVVSVQLLLRVIQQLLRA